MFDLRRRYHVCTVSGWLTTEAARRARPTSTPHLTAEVYDLASGARMAAFRTEDLRGPVAARRVRAVQLARDEAARLNREWRAERADLKRALAAAA